MIQGLLSQWQIFFFINIASNFRKLSNISKRMMLFYFIAVSLPNPQMKRIMYNINLF